MIIIATSRVACASFNIGTNTTITITRDSNKYTHTLTFKFGNATGTIATKTTQTSIVWSPTASTLYAEIPNKVSGYGTITCQTYNGSTLVGTSTAGFYAYAVKNNCLPTVTAAIEDTNASTIAVTGSSAKLVRYISKPKVTITATAKNSATIKTYNIYNPVGLVATTSTYTFDTVYSKEFRCTATDSRGYTTETKYNVNFVEYDPCHFTETPVIKRTESTSTTATITSKGYCFKGSFGTVNNTLTVKYRYKTATGNYGSYVNITPTWNTDGTFTASANVTNLSLSEQYTFEVIVQDKLTSFGDGEGIVLGQGIGDLRIGKDYIQTKNNVIIGNNTNTDWKGFRLRRTVNENNYEVNLGIGALNNKAIGTFEMYENKKVVARYDLRADGYLYSLFSNMSVAEIMSYAPSSTANGPQGNLLLNGGSSQPVLIQWGRVNITPTAANTSTTQEVFFPYSYSGLPVVKLEKISSDPAIIDDSAYNVNNDRFSIVIKRTNTAVTSVMWWAIGNGSNALPE